MSKYFSDLKRTLSDIWKLAQENIKKAQATQKRFYDRTAVYREFQEGDKVLILLPDRPCKMAMEWVGPGVVRKRLNEVNYQIECPEGSRTYHVNSLKKYYERPDSEAGVTVACCTVSNDEISARTRSPRSVTRKPRGNLLGGSYSVFAADRGTY